MIEQTDNFLPDRLAQLLRAYADRAEFEDLDNDADGVAYPGICSTLPAAVVTHVLERCKQAVGGKISRPTMFMRLSLPGMPAPHQAHHDAVMGTHSLMLYLTRNEHVAPGAGTSFVRHRSGDDEKFWERDTHRPEAWEVWSLCPMKFNRACLFDAALMHRAEPVGGFGTGRHDGRLVLTCFFRKES